LLGRAIGANRKNGDEGKALVKWMEEQMVVLYDLLNRGTLPGVAAGEVQLVASGTSAVSNTSVENESDGAARRAAVVYRDVPLVVVGKPTVLPDLWWRVCEAVNIELLTVENCTLEQARAFVEGQPRWRVHLDDNLAMVLARIRQALWDDSYLLGWIEQPPYRSD
jgi:hypothetical protein